MNRSIFISLLGFGLIVARAADADPVSELAGFSVFGGINLNELSKGEVKTANGPAMSSPRFLSTQSCYVVPGSPAKALEALRSWDPTAHRELKIYLHSDLPASPTTANFSRLKNAPDNSSVKALVNATEKMSPELQISREEAKKFTAGASASEEAMPGPVAAFWTEILTRRAQSFAAGGVSREAPYDHTSEAVSPAKESSGLLHQQGKINRQFGGFLEETGIIGGKGSLKPELYWELLDVDDAGVLTLGAFYSHTTAGGGYQAVDGLYYASGGYYVALTLYQMWPVQVEAKASTLVWRGDLVSAASLGELHGVERLASEAAMKKDISKAINLFRRDTVGH
ncbi:MAG: hypothetical protein ABJB32_07500 [Verrucomicrobiota bacterium]